MINYIRNTVFLILIAILLANCTATTGNKQKSVHGSEPLINPKEVVEKGQKEVQRIVDAGPRPFDAKTDNRQKKRKTITTEAVSYTHLTLPTKRIV